MDWFGTNFVYIYASLLGFVIVLVLITESSSFWEMMGYKGNSKSRRRKASEWEKSRNRLIGRQYRKY